MAKKYEWEQVYEAPGGRRYFRDKRSGRLAAADRSGYYPHQTEDGVLWIDKSAPMRVEWCRFERRNALRIPVVDEQGRASWMGPDIVELFWLAAVEGLSIYVEPFGRVRVTDITNEPKED